MWRLLDKHVLLSATEFIPPYHDHLAPGRLSVDDRTLWDGGRCRSSKLAALRLARLSWLKERLTTFSGRPAGELRMARGRYRKPFLQGRPLHFNVSHSGRYSVIALSRWPVGIDVEEMRPRKHFRQVAELWFHPEERHHLKGLPEEQAMPMFFCLWTRKEALAKAQGQAVSRVLSQDSLLWQPGLKWYARRHYWFLDLTVGKRRMCLCTRRRLAPVWR